MGQADGTARPPAARRTRGHRTIPRGRRDLWMAPLVLAVLGWDHIHGRWCALVARVRPATLAAGERGLLRQRADRAQSEERRG